MSKTLTEYEECAVMEIASGKRRRPAGSRSVSSYPQAIERGHRQGGNRVHGAIVVRACRVACRAASRPRRDCACRRRGAVEELAHRSLEECDQLAQDVSVHAQRRAIVELTAAGVAGIVGAALYVPVLLGAAIRAIRRIGHCYGYPLTTERDRHYVMGVLELATAEEPEVRQSIRARLYFLMHDPKMAPLELHGVRRALAEDLVSRPCRSWAKWRPSCSTTPSCDALTTRRAGCSRSGG